MNGTTLSDQEVATVLAALRYWQLAVVAAERRSTTRSSLIHWLPLTDHFTADLPPLGSDEIDELCERINCG